jgi:hypothetical protein
MSWWGNGYSLYALSLANGKTNQVNNSVVDFWVLCQGRFRNHIVILEDHLKLSGGHTRLYWLFDGDGRRISLVGTEESDLTTFLASQRK